MGWASVAIEGSPPSAAFADWVRCSAWMRASCGGVEIVLGLFVGRLRGDALGEQPLLAIEGLLLEGEVVGRGLLLGERLLVGRAELLDLEPGRCQRRLGAGERDAIGLRVDPEEEVARLDALSFSATATSTMRPETSAVTVTLSWRT